MNSRARLLTALNHREPDRIPLDLGSTQVTGIHSVAYRHLRACLGLPPVEPRLCDEVQQLASPDDDVIEHLGVDVRGLFPLNSHNWNILNVDRGEAWEYTDEWGITHRRLKPDGLYYSAVKHPLTGTISVDEIRATKWPGTGDPQRIAGLRQQAVAYRAQGQAVVLKGVNRGAFMANLYSFVHIVDIWGGIIKTLIFGFIIGLISCYYGYHVRGGAEGVGRAANDAVVRSIITFLGVNYFLTSALLALAR
jgi:hypothetical protein